MDSTSRPTRWNGNRPSSSTFGRQGWSQPSPSNPHETRETGPSHQSNWWHYESFPEIEAVYDHPSSSLREGNEDDQTRSRQDQGSAALNSARPSTSPTQPVLVKAYAGNARDQPKTKPSMMSPRRLFPFFATRSSAPSCTSSPPFPSDKDFSIDSILQAIDPDIRGTLDAIAEICGRSKLSLANEYGSHIAPLGEIRAPSGGGGLVPVEEASSSGERLADEGVVVYNDDPSTMEMRRDMHPFSFDRYLENLRHAANNLERSGGSTSLMAPQSAVTDQQSVLVEMERGVLPVIYETSSGPRNSGRDLLGKHKSCGRASLSSQDMSTSAVVSEVHFEAHADDQHTASIPETAANTAVAAGSPAPGSWNTSELIQSMFGWLRWATRAVEPDSRPALQSAEDRLREMLGRAADAHASLPAA